MPTGYTAELCEKDVPFKAFVLTCARAMGACIMQREEGIDVPPREEKPSSYHSEQIALARAQLELLRNTTNAEAEAAALASAREAERLNSEAIERARVIRGRLGRMRALVSAWEPPTPDHVGLKRFTLDQLETTIHHDGTVGDWYEKQIVYLCGAEWRARKIEEAERDLVYHTKQNAEEIARVNERNQWIRDLRASLGE